ncbi:phosphatidylserine decarboxylase [Limibacillus halophilus]|uniref:Phosphatidylserine decarboxylase proenzyme n=1 Tax=Limibacillus halophilus TaxID=1579333 RepID=A0A839STY8_9PROT|nr:phosphatidylserine decarboxylase [Limibacillus halophilus]MBB3066261.1 phosphatidylserine decarboxylase [Limibacillus halophilus]
MDMLKIVAPPIHSEGWKFIGIFAAVTLVLFLFIEPLGWIGAGATLWCYYFFRDPERATPLREGLVISPADGKVCSVAPVAPPSTLGLGDEPRVRVSIFMNVFNCHVNRLPIAGRITKIVYTPGKFLNASLDKASEDNERNALAVEIDGGYGDLGVVQIAGLVARRILCEVEEDRHLETGERFGMIRFGSRLDVYLPVGSASLVAVGQTAVAGETVIADLTSKEAQRGARIS